MILHTDGLVWTYHQYFYGALARLYGLGAYVLYTKYYVPFQLYVAFPYEIGSTTAVLGERVGCM